LQEEKMAVEEMQKQLDSFRQISKTLRNNTEGEKEKLRVQLQKKVLIFL
jgi:hypothetical protein